MVFRKLGKTSSLLPAVNVLSLQCRQYTQRGIAIFMKWREQETIELKSVRDNWVICYCPFVERAIGIPTRRQFRAA